MPWYPLHGIKNAPADSLVFRIFAGGQGINTLPEDHGTEWFSDTSQAAVQHRLSEARANSVGLDALARRRSDGGDSGGNSDASEARAVMSNE